MIAIIDYDAGNVKSVQKALAYLHEDTILTRDPKQLLAAEKVILPGVGAFGDAMGKLKEYGLSDFRDCRQEYSVSWNLPWFAAVI